MKRVLVTIPVPEKYRPELEQAGRGCEIVYVPVEQVTGEDVARAEIILGNVPPATLKEAGRLEWLHLSSSGADAYVQPGLLPEGVRLTNSTGAYSQAVAEHAFALTLMLQKNLHLYRDGQSRKRWQSAGAVSSISDSVTAVIGLGDIGLYYARLVKALGGRVLGVKRRPGPCPEGVDELHTMEALPEVLGRADVVMSVLPETPETHHLFDGERFAAMKPGAIFVNVGRGPAVEEKALQAALESGHLKAAALDVTEREPLPADSPLWELPTLFLTPHVAGYYHLAVTLDRVTELAIRNLAAYVRGEELENPVDFATGYRK